jgi:hypothetical protein
MILSASGLESLWLGEETAIGEFLTLRESTFRARSMTVRQQITRLYPGNLSQ